MKIFCLLIFLAAAPFAWAGTGSFSFPHDYVEIDFLRKNIKFNNFSLGGYIFEGSLSFAFKESKGLFLCELKGYDFKALGRSWPRIDALFTKDGEFIVLKRFDSPEFKGHGKLNLAESSLKLDIDFDFWHESDFLSGEIKGKAAVWGHLDNLLVSGDLVISDGRYQGYDFSKFSMNFLGRPPVLGLTDSRIYLSDGNVYNIEGVMDLRDFGDLFPDAEYISRRVSFDGWRVQADNKDIVGLEKKVGRRFGLLVDTQNDVLEREAGTELHYNMENGKFFKMRFQEDKTIVGFERRKEF